MSKICDNLAIIHDRIAHAEARAGRAPGSVKLLAVSKTHPARVIREALHCGQRLFGESYVQEFAAKAAEVVAPVSWHFIGALQSNKVKYLRGLVDLFHSVDRLSLAEEIDRQWGKDNAVADILLQINLGGEETKSGTDEAGLVELARRVTALPHLRLRGLMALPPYVDDPEEVRPYFRRLRELLETLQGLALPRAELTELSMGMSHDFEVAVEEGATLVRVGTSIFGARAPKEP